MPLLRIGTRQSLLARTQSLWVADSLRKNFHDLQVELMPMATSGDNRGSPGKDGGLKALFTKEIEDALLDNRIDLAVHSMKDMPGELPKGLGIGAVPPREDPRDAWIARDGQPFLKTKPGARVGTGSIRRQAELKHYRTDLELVGMRGNVDTRLRKLHEENLDGLILAIAGLKRLGRATEATEILSTDILLPAVGQGALAVEIREADRSRLDPYLRALDHPATHYAILAERAFLRALGGSCQTPIAAYAEMSHGRLTLQGLVVASDGKRALRDADESPMNQAEAMGDRLARKLLTQGAAALL